MSILLDRAMADAGITSAKIKTNGQAIKLAFKPRIVGRCMADIAPEKLHWLWPPDKLSSGRLNVIAGDGGVGKSYLTMGIASIVTRGCGWPGISETTKPGDVLLLNDEDNLADTIRPRLDACGADCSKIHTIEGIRRREHGDTSFINLADDIAAIEHRIEETNSILFILDPIGSYLRDVDSHKDSAVRSVLAPLASVARRTGCAIITVMHTNKSNSTKASDRLIGSVAFKNIARTAWLIRDDPTEKGKKLFLNFKSNNAPKPTGLAFKIENDAICWLDGAVTQTADEAIATETSDASSAREDAADWLLETLAIGPMRSDKIKELAAKHKISWRTLGDSKSDVGVKAVKRMDGWYWEIQERSGSV